MQRVLILGASGRFGRNAAAAFAAAGWVVDSFDRQTQDLMSAARGADVIVNGWNPPYPDWARQVPDLHRRVIAAAEECSATVILPGNVYVFDAATPGPWSAATPHRAQNPLGRIRIAMEDAYRSSGVRTILLRAGDFIDTSPSGNWFDRVMIPRLHQGRLIYPGATGVPHAWAFLPDLARAAVVLAEKRAELPRYCDIPFPGFTLSGDQLAQALTRTTGRPVAIRRMAWWPLSLLRPIWPMARHLIEMRYLWNTAHSLDGASFDSWLPGFTHTDLDNALAQAISGIRPSEQAKDNPGLVRSA